MFKKWHIISIIFLLVVNLYFLVQNSDVEKTDKEIAKINVKDNTLKVTDEKLLKPIIGSVEKKNNLEILENSYYIKNVPFIIQAPKADWKDERQQDGCEEASAVIASAWINNESSISKNEALKRILEASTWFEKYVGTFHDASVEDVIHLFNEFYKIETVKIVDNPSLDDLKKFISENKIILVPTNGQLLGNPYFSGAGPERHMIVLRGYDDKTGEFIVNDPGTRRGENYHYSYETVMKANLAYPTGFHEKVENARKAVIVVSR